MQVAGESMRFMIQLPRFTLLGLAALILAGGIRAQELFVAPPPLGNALGDGSRFSPLAQIQAAIDAATTETVQVTLLPGTYTGDGNREINFKGKPLRLVGESGAEATIIDCERRSRGFFFGSGEDSRTLVQGVAILNGEAAFANNLARGGGIYCEGASPVIRKCLIQNCAARGQFIFNSSGGSGVGGGIYLKNSNAWIDRCTVTECISEGGIGQGFLGNGGNANGAGISSEGGTPLVSGCNIIQNDARAGSGSQPGTANGGGIYVVRGGLRVERTRIEENSVAGGNAGLGPGRGGGFYAESAKEAVIKECNFEGNLSLTFGGSAVCMAGNSGTMRIDASTIYQNFIVSAGGGAVQISGGKLTLVNSTVSSNSVIPLADIGCGLNVTGGDADVVNCTFVDNSGFGGAGGFVASGTGKVHLQNDIFAFNKPRNATGTFTSVGGNVSTDGTGASVGVGDLRNTDPLLGPLRVNGGTIRTYALERGSPAIDTGVNAGLPAFDQRGAPRILDGDGDGYSSADAGAYEYPRPYDSNAAEFSEIYE